MSPITEFLFFFFIARGIRLPVRPKNGFPSFLIIGQKEDNFPYPVTLSL